MSAMAGVDWEKALDISQAKKNVESEFFGDWYNDPWGWPELEFLVKHSTKDIVEHINGSSSCQVACWTCQNLTGAIDPRW